MKSPIENRKFLGPRPWALAPRPFAFTLIELLVVVSIIAILLALLMPALDRSIYQAELAVCGANLKTVGTGVMSYATENKRLYPYRPSADTTSNNYTHSICHPSIGDDRPYLRNHMGLDALLCPLSGKVDIDSPPSSVWVFSNFSLWFGVKFALPNGGTRMRRIGDRLDWTDRSRNAVRKNRISVLASDLDAAQDFPVSLSSHPEIEPQFMHFLAYVTAGQVSSDWRTDGVRQGRNPTDLNYLYSDGSMTRFNAVEWNDDRMARVPFYHNVTGPFEDNSSFWHQLPAEQ